MKERELEVVAGDCLCGGTLFVNEENIFMHSLPTCKDFDAVETLNDAIDLLRRSRHMRLH